MTASHDMPRWEEYVARILAWFVKLPDTPHRCCRHDLACAGELHRRGVALETIECALLLGSLRRLGRPPDSPPLAPIRSLAYFLPVVEELTANPVEAGYLDYLRHKMRIHGGKKKR